jgi:hypothetical protein
MSFGQVYLNSYLILFYINFMVISTYNLAIKIVSSAIKIKMYDLFQHMLEFVFVYIS